MQTMRIRADRFFDGERFITDKIVVYRDGRLAEVTAGGDYDREAECLSASPLDEHNHGAFGFDAARPTLAGAEKWLMELARRGVGEILYTISTAEEAVFAEAMDFVAELMDRQKRGKLPGAKIAGVHLEGPFINPRRAGAMDAAKILAPSVAAYERIVHGHGEIVRLITMAPEVAGAEELIRYLAAKGVCVQAGHTDATVDEAKQAFAAGVDGICHFYNAARGIHHREPGILAAAMLADGVYAEMIADGVHVHELACKLLVRAKGAHRVLLISDSVPTAGLPDGEYYAANHKVVVREGRNYTPEGGIAGSACQLDEDLRTLLGWGFAPEIALTMATATPRRHLRLEGVASLTAWDGAFRPQWCLTNGEIIKGGPKTCA